MERRRRDSCVQLHSNQVSPSCVGYGCWPLVEDSPHPSAIHPLVPNGLSSRGGRRIRRVREWLGWLHVTCTGEIERAECAALAGS